MTDEVVEVHDELTGTKHRLPYDLAVPLVAQPDASVVAHVLGIAQDANGFFPEVRCRLRPQNCAEQGSTFAARPTAPTASPHQDPELRARLDPEEADQRLANFIKATAEEIKILTMLSGHDDISDLSEEDLWAMDLNTAAITGLKRIGYEKRLPWWENGRGS